MKLAKYSTTPNNKWLHNFCICAMHLEKSLSISLRFALLISPLQFTLAGDCVCNSATRHTVAIIDRPLLIIFTFEHMFCVCLLVCLFACLLASLCTCACVCVCACAYIPSDIWPKAAQTIQIKCERKSRRHLQNFDYNLPVYTSSSHMISLEKRQRYSQFNRRCCASSSSFYYYYYYFFSTVAVVFVVVVVIVVGFCWVFFFFELLCMQNANANSGSTSLARCLISHWVYAAQSWCVVNRRHLSTMNIKSLIFNFITIGVDIWLLYLNIFCCCWFDAARAFVRVCVCVCYRSHSWCLLLAFLGLPASLSVCQASKRISKQINNAHKIGLPIRWNTFNLDEYAFVNR